MKEFYETSYDMASKKGSDMEGVLFGQEDCAPSHSYGPTLRSYHLFHFVTRGQGRLDIGGSSFSLSAGDAFLIPAEQMSYYEASAEYPWSYSWAGFIGIRATQYVNQILTLAPEHYVLRGLKTDRYAEAIKKAALLEGTSAGNYFCSEIVLYELFSFLSEELPGILTAGIHSSLASRVKFYIDAKYTEKIRVDELAAHFSVHPNHLSRAFHLEYGLAPKHYLMKLKLEKAAAMLRGSDMPVGMISESLGFEDQHAFSRAFKSYWGFSPMNSRKKRV